MRRGTVFGDWGLEVIFCKSSESDLEEENGVSRSGERQEEEGKMDGRFDNEVNYSLVRTFESHEKLEYRPVNQEIFTSVSIMKSSDEDLTHQYRHLNICENQVELSVFTSVNLDSFLTILSLFKVDTL